MSGNAAPAPARFGPQQSGGLFPIILGAALIALGGAVLYYDLKGAF